MAGNGTIDCADLSVRTSFANYILTVEIVTQDNLSLLASCKPELCTALWGSGNPDISGIGVSHKQFVSYVSSTDYANPDDRWIHPRKRPRLASLYCPHLYAPTSAAKF